MLEPSTFIMSAGVMSAELAGAGGAAFMPRKPRGVPRAFALSPTPPSGTRGRLEGSGGGMRGVRRAVLPPRAVPRCDSGAKAGA